MSVFSRIGKIVHSAGHVAAHSFDTIRDAAASLDDDDQALSFGDFLAFFKKGAQAHRVSTPLVINTANRGAVAPHGQLQALGVPARGVAPGPLIPQGVGEQLGTLAGGVSDLVRPSLHTLRNDLIEPVTSRIPEPVRAPGAATGGFAFHSFADPIAATVDKMNDAYNGVSRGITTVVLASELRADKDFQATIKNKPFGEQLGYVNRLAWDAAKETSPGQAIMYSVLGGNNIDITDPVAIGRVLDSPLFHSGSGAIDAGLRLYADPTAVALGRAKAVVEATRVKQAFNFASEAASATGTAAEEAAGVDKLYQAFKDAESPAEVRRRFFPSRNNQAAHIQATVLWDAAHMPDEVALDPLHRAQTAGGLGPSAPGIDIGTEAGIPRVPRTPSQVPGEGGPITDIGRTGPPSREKFNTVLRAMLGNDEAAGLLRDADAAMAERVAFAQHLRNWAHPILTPDPTNPLYRVSMPDFVMGNPLQLASEGTTLTAEQRAQLDKMIDSLVPDAIRASREKDLIGTLAASGGTLPRATARSAFRTGVVRSEFWQTSRLGRTLRVFADINPQTYLNLHEADFDVHVDRMLTNIGFDQASRDTWRTTAMRAAGAGERRAILANLDDAVIDHFASKYGIDATVLREARDAGRSELDNMLNSARYDTETETTILRTLNEAGEAEDYHLPLHPTQLENWAGLPNYKGIDELAKKQAAKWTTRELVTAFAEDQFLNPFYKYWKPAVLLGIRTPTRIVGEEAVRFMSQVGAMTAAKAIGTNVAYKVGDVFGVTDEALRYLPGVARRAVETPLAPEGVAASLGAEGVRNAWSGALDASAGGVLQYGSLQDKAFADMADSVKDWKTLSGTDPGHLDAWVNDINKQIRQSRLARRLLENDGDIADAVRWLWSSDEGKVTLRANRLWARDPEGWAMSIEDQLQRYLPTDELRAAAKAGPVTGDMLTSAFPEAASRPAVHGQMLGYTIGRDHVSRSLIQKLDAFQQLTAVQPSIQLTRQPMFDIVYRQAIEDQASQAIKLGRREAWSMDEVRQVERNAHREAIGAVRETLYDMAEHSRFAEATRFVSPFANASREVITTWAGIAMKNPAFVRRMQIAWKAPERAGWVYDGEGNQVHADGSATSPLGQKVKATPGRYIRARFPEWANDIPLIGHVVPDHDVYVNKDSLNTILANPYGSSPVVEVALARLADNAALETKLAPFFPYGIERSVYKPFLPSTLRAARGRFDQEEQGRAAMQLYWTNVAAYEANGRQGPKPKISDAMSAAGHFALLQVLAKVVLPASVREASPMQPYIDIYKEMQRKDPEHAQENFLDKYGSEFASLTLSMTKTVNHVQPTLNAWKRSQEFNGFIAKYPELGAVAVGEVSDPFNPAVYDRQLRTRVGGENYDKQRKRITLNEAQEAPGVTAGWHEFSQAMDIIESERIRRKLPNLRVKQAQQLAAAKKAFVDGLGEKYPEWRAAYMEDNPAAYEHRMAGMREIVAKLGGHGRTDIDHLGYYLDLRDTIESVLNTRVGRKGSGQLDSASNRDLLLAWETGVGRLVEASPAFQRMWNRYLDHDEPVGHKQ